MTGAILFSHKITQNNKISAVTWEKENKCSLGQYVCLSKVTTLIVRNTPFVAY